MQSSHNAVHWCLPISKPLYSISGYHLDCGNPTQLVDQTLGQAIRKIPEASVRAVIVEVQYSDPARV
jgi:hypothetical protein